MVRPALSATRVVAVLEFLAANPTAAHTLTEIADGVGVNVASTHAVLHALTVAGYLVRQPRRRTYTLGPSVVALGSAGLEAHPAIDLARDTARRLARETKVEVAVTTRAGNDIVFLAAAGEPSARGVPVHVGQRVPFNPPLGSVFVAWGHANAWLQRANDDSGGLAAVLGAVRRRGYSVALEIDVRRALGYAARRACPRALERGTPRHRLTTSELTLVDAIISCVISTRAGATRCR